MKIISKIKINISFYFIMFLFLYSGYINIFFSYIFILIIHDLGHIIFIKLFKNNITKIIIFPFGGIINIDSGPRNNFLKELFISIGGILSQVILIIFLKNPDLIRINRYIILTNILPVKPLDGSKTLSCILKLFINEKKLLKVDLYVNLIVIFILILWQLKSCNINIFFIVFTLTMSIKEHKKSINNYPYYSIKKNIEKYSVFIGI